nr:capsid scaffold protein [Murid betaherpesvirus 2]
MAQAPLGVVPAAGVAAVGGQAPGFPTDCVYLSKDALVSILSSSSAAANARGNAVAVPAVASVVPASHLPHPPVSGVGDAVARTLPYFDPERAPYGYGIGRYPAHLPPPPPPSAPGTGYPMSFPPPPYAYPDRGDAYGGPGYDPRWERTADPYWERQRVDRGAGGYRQPGLPPPREKRRWRSPSPGREEDDGDDRDERDDGTDYGRRSRGRARHASPPPPRPEASRAKRRRAAPGEDEDLSLPGERGYPRRLASPPVDGRGEGMEEVKVTLDEIRRDLSQIRAFARTTERGGVDESGAAVGSSDQRLAPNAGDPGDATTTANKAAAAVAGRAGGGEAASTAPGAPGALPGGQRTVNASCAPVPDAAASSSRSILEMNRRMFVSLLNKAE